MTLEQFVSTYPDFDNLSASEKIPILGYYKTFVQSNACFTAADIKNSFDELHLEPYSNIYDHLSRKSKGKSKIYMKTKVGYKLERSTIAEIRNSTMEPQFNQKVSTKLREHVNDKLPDASKEFIGEAISCFENNLFRSALIMTWLFIFDHHNNYIIKYHLSAFNSELLKEAWNKKLLSINSIDDFGDIKESINIEISKRARVISGDVAKIMKRCLDDRNSFAHPSSLKLSEEKVCAYIIELLDNVVAKYPIS